MMMRSCLALLRQADELRHRDPRAAVRVAEGGRDLAARLDREKVGQARWLALQAEAWAVLGSAYRAVADQRRAENAFNVAGTFLDTWERRRCLDPLARPRLAQRASYLRCDQGRFEEAMELNGEAMTAYRELAATQHFAGTLVDRALFLGRQQKTRTAMACLVPALYLLDPVASSRSYRAAVHNMTIYLHESSEGEPQDPEAGRWLALAARQHARFPDDVDHQKFRMLEGSVAIRLGAVDEGIRKLWMAHDGFERLGSLHNQAVVLLQLAGISLARGETANVRKIAGRLFPVLRRLNVDRETNAALMLFYKAAQADAVTRDLLDRALRGVGEGRGALQLTI